MRGSFRTRSSTGGTRWVRTSAVNVAATPSAVSLAADVLLDDAARSRGLYNVAALGDDVRAGSWRDHHALWRALSVELWLRRFDRNPVGAGPVAA